MFLYDLNNFFKFFREAGHLVEKFTSLYYSFCQLNITLEAYVCLKAITILHYPYSNIDGNN